MASPLLRKRNTTMMRRKLVALAPALLLLAPAGCDRPAAEQAQAKKELQAVPVTVAPVEHRPVERTVEVVGTLKGWEEVTIGSKKMGRVVKVYHDMGDRVGAEERLVDLEVIDADLAIAQAEKRLQSDLAKLGLSGVPTKEFDVEAVPSVMQAQVALDRGRQDLARARSLTQRGAGTLQEYQNAESDLKAAEAGLENAIVTARSNMAAALAGKVALDVARQSRTDMEIRAPKPSSLPKGTKGPISYALTRRDVAEGQMVREGDKIAALVIESPLRLWTNVPERFAAEVEIGQPVKITVASHPGEQFRGEVARINPSVDPVSRTFQVEAAVPNEDGRLRPGGFAKASILTNREDAATVVPIESVIRFAGVTKLFVVRDNIAHAINVETGLEFSGKVEVIGELPADAPVVTTGQSRLAEGTPVVIREPESGESPNAPKPDAPQGGETASASQGVGG
jgi:membrane fusion protein, multidrug efflux system